MRRGVSLLLALILPCALLTSCNPESTGPGVSEVVSVAPAPTVTPEPEDTENPESEPTSWIGPMIDIDWPDYPPFQPEVSVFPLTNTRELVKISMDGPVTFVDEGLTPFALPVEAVSYGIVSNQFGYGEVKAYSLLLSDTGVDILMLTDGTIPLDADGRYIGLLGDTYYIGSRFHAYGSSVITRRAVEEHDPWRPFQHYLYGLYDMEERRELLPMEYGLIEAVGGRNDENGLYYATRDNTVYLLDSKGKVLWQEDGYDPYVLPHYTTWGNKYTLNAEQRMYYRTADIDLVIYDRLTKWGDYYIRSTQGSSNAFGILSITDATWQEFYFNQHSGFIPSDDHVIIMTPYGYDVLEYGGGLRHFPFPAEELQPPEFIFYGFDGSEMRYTDAVQNRSYALDEAGHVREVGLLTLNPGVHQGGPVYCVYDTGVDPYYGRWQIRDDQGGVLLETENRLLYHNAGFITEHNYSWEETYTTPRAVYALNGTLLLGDVFGFIPEAPAPGGGMFVYLDETTCVLLYPDGTTVPVPGAPAVESFHGSKDTLRR